MRRAFASGTPSLQHLVVDVGGVPGAGEVDHTRGDAAHLLLCLLLGFCALAGTRRGAGMRDVKAALVASSQGAGGKLLDHAFRVRAQGLEDVHQGRPATGR